MNRNQSIVAVGGAVAAMALVGVLGSLAPAQSAPQVGYRAGDRTGGGPVVGRRTDVCPVPTSDRTATGSTNKVSVGAVATNPSGPLASSQAGEGTLTGRLLTVRQPALTVRAPGHGALLPGPKEPVVLQASGAMASTSGAAVFALAATGPDRGLSIANCAAPATEYWFVGVGSSEEHRTELVLTNPDNSQAIVDLRFFGPDGQQTAPGGVGIAVPSQDTRTIALEALVPGKGSAGKRPLSVRVRASAGRIAAAARDRQSETGQPAGTAWNTGAAAPARSTLLPGIPGGKGERELVVVNPNDRRATVKVAALGADGSFAPVDADTVEVDAQSSASVRLDQALAAENVAVRLTADQPVTGTVRSTSSRRSASPDIAVQPAAGPLRAAGLSPFAVATGASSIVSLTNAGRSQVTVPIQLVGYDAKVVFEDKLTLAPGTTSTKKLSAAGSAYLVADPPAGSSVYGGIVVSQDSGKVAGLATSPLLSPNLSAAAPEVTPDPAAARSAAG